MSQKLFNIFMQRFLFSERTRSAVCNGAVYNGVKCSIAAPNFYVPSMPINKGLCPTKSSLLKQVKKFPGKDMFLN